METTILSLSSLAFNELEAFVELMFLAAYADSRASDAERDTFRGQVIKGTHGVLDDALLDQMLATIEARVLLADRDAQLQLIRERLADPRKRHAAMVHAARVVLADGGLEVSERDFMERAAVALGETQESLAALLQDAQDGGIGARSGR